MLTLYNYFRSSASYRVRIALNLKHLDYQYQAIHLLKDGGEQFSEEYQRLNPQNLVPVLKDDDTILTQSLAIIEYLEETYPKPALLPVDVKDRAYVRSIAYAIACDIHPLNNLRVLKYLQGPMALSEQQKITWMQHWIQLGFQALEQRLEQHGCNNKYCFGDEPTLADIVLIPQIQNARRIKLPMETFPRLLTIEEHCLSLPAFFAAHPNNQPDKGMIDD